MYVIPVSHFVLFHYLIIFIIIFMGLAPIDIWCLLSDLSPVIAIRRWWLSSWVFPMSLLRIRMTGDWESRKQSADPGLPGKWPLKWCVYWGCAFGWTYTPSAPVQFSSDTYSTTTPLFRPSGSASFLTAALPEKNAAKITVFIYQTIFIQMNAY